jgi:hypothetical protein
MTAKEIPHPWQEIQRAHGVEVTAVNPLELGRPFRFTDAQRAILQPYLEAAGEGGAVLVLVTRSAFENYLHATPLAVTAKNRRTLSASLTRLKKETHATLHPTRP